VESHNTKAGLTIQPSKEAKRLLLSIPLQEVSPVDGKKSPADAFQDTELDDRDVKIRHRL